MRVRRLESMILHFARNLKQMIIKVCFPNLSSHRLPPRTSVIRDSDVILDNQSWTNSREPEVD